MIPFRNTVLDGVLEMAWERGFSASGFSGWPAVQPTRPSHHEPWRETRQT
jgi:hypothetical protein